MKIIRIFIASIFILSFSVAVWLQTGRKAENFTAVTMEGDTIDLLSLRGKVVLLTFWSSRCPICQSEIPNLNELAAGYANRDIVFLAATMENENLVDAYLKRHPFDFQILPNSFGLLLKYADRDKEGRVNIWFPAYFVIDRSGLIRYKDNGWDKTKPLSAAINKALTTH